MTQAAKDSLGRWTELITKLGAPYAILCAVLYFHHVDVVKPQAEALRILSVAYERMASAMDTQTLLIKDIRDERRAGQ